MANKLAAFMSRSCNRLWSSFSLQNLPFRLTFGKLQIQRNLCSKATDAKEQIDREEHLDPPAHLLQSRGMGTPVLEEHTPVHPEVAEILRKSKGQLVDGKWHKPLYNARALAALRNEYIAKGFYWPERPMRDRGLDRTPKGHKRAIRKEERLARIAENMAKMPEIVADYRERMREKRAKLKKEKEEARLRKINAQRLGYDVRDPRALMAMKGELADLKRKNRWKRPKKVKLGTIA